jgi:membrane AbrB-like protein
MSQIGRFKLGRPKHPWRWATLFALSLAVAAFLERETVPAALLIGPMVVAICFGVGGAGLEMPRVAFIGSQAIVGCLIASTLTPAIVGMIAHDWIPMLVVVASSVVSAGTVGWALTRFGSLPGTTAAWGSSPGGASAMIVMAQAYGADIRLVAFMQYLRVIVVVLSASVVSHLLLANAPGAAVAHEIPAIAPSFSAPLVPLLETLAIAAIGALLGTRIPIPAGGMFVPMGLAVLFRLTGWVEIALPLWVLGIAYGALGWYIGLGFTRAVVRYAFRAIPQLLLGTALLIGMCAFAGWLLTLLLDVDALTAYLATAPGGLDSIAIIAIGSHADIPFVLALQTLRVFVVILSGPYIAKLITKFA